MSYHDHSMITPVRFPSVCPSIPVSDYSSETAEMSVLVDVAIREECCMASADMQWLICSRERIVDYGPLFFFLFFFFLLLLFLLTIPRCLPCCSSYILATMSLCHCVFSLFIHFSFFFRCLGKALPRDSGFSWVTSFIFFYYVISCQSDLIRCLKNACSMTA